MQEFLTGILIALESLSLGAAGHPTSLSADIIHEPVVIEVRVKEEEKKERKELCGIEALKDFYGDSRDTFERAMENIPCELLLGLQKVSVFHNPERPRAMSSSRHLYIRNDLFDLPEAEKVLIHELAHIVDLSGIRSERYREKSAFVDGNAIIYADDKSVEFYEISWKGNTSWQPGITLDDFVTGYAATDPFEDFAESFLLYIKNGNLFREIAKQSPALQKKYDFLKEQVFSEKEFFTGDTLYANIQYWDATKL